MKKNKIGILASLLVLVMAAEPVSAATYTVTPSMTNAQIQNIINSASSGSTIQFATGTYNGVQLNVTKPLNLKTYNGTVTLKGISSEPVFNVLNTGGVSINGFTINGSSASHYICLSNVNRSTITKNTFNNNVNNTNAVYIFKSNIINITNNIMNMFNQGDACITGDNQIYDIIIKNNTMLNGGSGISVGCSYKNLTITNNTINHMIVNHGDGIYLEPECGSNETNTKTTITKNIITNISMVCSLVGISKEPFQVIE